VIYRESERTGLWEHKSGCSYLICYPMQSLMLHIDLPEIPETRRKGLNINL